VSYGGEVQMQIETQQSLSVGGDERDEADIRKAVESNDEVL
jgi:hypothetical protein